MTNGSSGNEGLKNQLASLRHGDHACSFYASAAEQEAQVISFMKEGLACGERCVYVVDDRTADEIVTGLTRAGVDVSHEQARGALYFINKAQWRTPGDFDIAVMAEGVKRLVNQALAPGWPGLWVAVEMTWALSPDIDPERLAEWEAFWNHLITEMPVVLLCQYNRLRIPPAAIYLELKTHPLVVTPHEVYRNFYYEPPDLFLNQGAYGERVAWMLEQFQQTRAIEEERVRRRQEQAARVQAETARERVTSILESITDGFFALDSQGQVTYLNKRAEQLLQIRREELLGKKAWGEFPSAVSSLLGVDHCQQAVAEQVAVEFEWFSPPLNTWFTVHVYPSHTGLSVYFHDITERKQAEEALRCSEQELADFFDNATVGLHWVGPDGTILRVNQAELDLLGYTREEYVGHNIAEFHADPSVIENILHCLTRGETLHDYEARLRCKDGALKTVLISSNVLWKGDRFIHTRCFTRDITDRKRAEAALARRTMELQRSNEELQQFAYVASHDLQEPLRMVATFVDLLARRYQGKLDTEAEEFIGYAIGGAKRMKALIDDLLAYSRVGTHEEPFGSISCKEILQHTLQNLRLAIEENEAVITHESLPVVQGNETQIALLLQNLLSNALKFRNGAPPRIHLSAQPRGAEWLFSVRDNGIGLDPQYAERIFVIFQRLHSPKEYPGTGLGLAICKKIIERHGGRIWVESELGKGATFFFTLPATGKSVHLG
jgi:PAS domain S-box-containing protein